jgi:membrane associated rhomboid family serine protease
MLLPIRTEKETRRLPNLTIGLIALNFIIWIFTNNIVSRENRELESLHQQLMEIEGQYFDLIIKEHSDLLQINDIRLFHEEILKRGIIPENNPIFHQWLALYQEFENKINNTFFHKWGFIPARFNLIKLIISMFLHANLFHVLGNMLYLWIVGCNMEDDWGWLRFLGFYLLSGLAAGFFHSLYGSSMTIPCIGASGAVAGVMGAFMIFHFKTKIRFFYLFPLLLRGGTFKVWAGAVLPFWFLQEILFASSKIQTGSAHWAHIGGFVFGAIIALVNRYLSESKENESLIDDNSESNNDVASEYPEEICKEPMTPIPSDWGNDPIAVSRLNEIIRTQPNNYPARIQMGRICLQNGYIKDAAVSLGLALETAYEKKDKSSGFVIYNELKSGDLLKEIPDHSLFKIGLLLESSGRYNGALNIYQSYVKWHPAGILRARAIFRTYKISKHKLQNEAFAKQALMLLRKDYPEIFSQA